MHHPPSDLGNPHAPAPGFPPSFPPRPFTFPDQLAEMAAKLRLLEEQSQRMTDMRYTSIFTSMTGEPEINTFDTPELLLEHATAQLGRRGWLIVFYGELWRTASSAALDSCVIVSPQGENYSSKLKSLRAPAAMAFFGRQDVVSDEELRPDAS